MKEPDKKEIDQAKRYIRQRLQAELSMEYHLSELFKKAAEMMIKEAYSYHIPPSVFSFTFNPMLEQKVDSILGKLEDMLLDDFYTLAESTPYKDDETSLIPYLGREINGSTLQNRMEEYLYSFRSEVQKFIEAGLLASIPMKKLQELAKKEIRNLGHSSLVENKGISSFNAMNRLLRYGIADAYMYADYDWMKRRGAFGYILYRGSSYPCELCDSMVGYHNIEDWVLPLHPNCMCFAVPITEL